MNLADRLKIARESTGKGQKDMATLCHASYRTWQGYEAGETQPNAKAFEALVNMGFNVNWLLTGEGEMRNGPQQGSMEYILDAERRAEVVQSVKQFGCYPLDQGLLKRSLEGAYEWVETEGLKPDAETIFKIMMYRYNLVATIKFGALQQEGDDKECAGG